MRELDGLPTDPADLALMVQALVDGELDAAAALAVERRLAADPTLAAEHARLIALQSAVRRLPRVEPSTDFAARMAALAGPPQSASAPLTRDNVLRLPDRPPRRFDWRALAASVVFGAVVAGGMTAWLDRAAPPESFADAVADSHRRSLLAANPFDIASSDRHTVKPWLDARIGVSPPAADLTQDGFTLLGGRVEVFGDRPMPALVYRHREHLITLVAAPRGVGARAPVATDLSAGGFAVVHWTDDAFSYWAISDMERPELDAFAKLFREKAGGT